MVWEGGTGRRAGWLARWGWDMENSQSDGCDAGMAEWEYGKEEWLSGNKRKNGLSGIRGRMVEWEYEEE
ncbi:hypothetical protein Pmani_022714 [Petrolisthes manimaculis]|uniref:Uncharacterized protein n=1 Tax=Petrolisthes manimaculis TaxID=1843537 RepID=A0AAE1U0V9_9EUCA|nr:hypothetical protein Pmani_022714 [Petrolisthes manimaculis]